MTTLRATQTLTFAPGDDVHISLLEQTRDFYHVRIKYSSINKSMKEKLFQDFESAKDDYLQTIGAFYCDGWR